VNIEQNVAYNTAGHCFFMEDGAETGNSLIGNLAMNIRKPDPELKEKPLLASDNEPAAFWITNPANTVRGNVAAGSDAFGFWYALPNHPTGSSAAAGANIWPRKTALGEFKDNVAHSNFTGLNVDNGQAADGSNTEIAYYKPVQTPADEKSASVQAVFNTFSAYKNRFRGVWMRGEGLLLKGGVLADNAIGATFAAHKTGIEDTLLVGETANLGTPASWEITGEGGRTLPQPWKEGASFPIRGFEFYDGVISARNLSIARYVPTAQRSASGLGYNRKNEFDLNPANNTSGIRWLDASNKVLLETPEVGKDGDSAATFLDTDGSVTGAPGQYVVAKNPLLTPGCTWKAEWNASVCAGPFLRFWMDSVSGETMGTAKFSAGGNELSVVGSPDNHTEYSTTLAIGGRYNLAIAAPKHLRIGFDRVVPGQSMRFDIAYAGSPSLYRNWWVDPRNLMKKVSAASLDGASGDVYALENGVLSVKMVVKPGDDYAELEICASAGC
jgi:hypothetical protein